MEPQNIFVHGAQQHNLKHIDVHIPRNKLVVLTGVSGSGKSSLAFDTIYAEGQRRYVESLSAFARQFIGQMEKPKVDAITGLSPAIAIEQKAVSKNPRSTVGTVTEVMDYLRVLFARAGVPHCPDCGRVVQPQSAQQIADQLAALPAGTRFQLLSPHRPQSQRDPCGCPVGRRGSKALCVLASMVKWSIFPPGCLNWTRKQNTPLNWLWTGLLVPEILDEGFLTRLMDSVETTLRIC